MYNYRFLDEFPLLVAWVKAEAATLFTFFGMKKKFADIKTFRNFVATYIPKGVLVRLLTAGFFYACISQIIGSVTPCKSVIGLLSFGCKSTGSAEPFYIFAKNKQQSAMTYAEKEVCKKDHRRSLDTRTPERNQVLTETKFTQCLIGLSRLERKVDEALLFMRKKSAHVPTSKAKPDYSVTVGNVGFNPYLIAVMSSFTQFLKDEREGCVCSEMRLAKNLESARKLFSEGINELYRRKNVNIKASYHE